MTYLHFSRHRYYNEDNIYFGLEANKHNLMHDFVSFKDI
jgi:hypothetical protein